MSQSDPNEEEQQGTESIGLFQHETRPDWGRAVLAWEREGKRGYQFEDGKLRVFSEGYFDRLVADTSPSEEKARVAEALGRRLGWKAAAPSKPTRKKAEGVPVQQQVELFASLYPKGFVGARWAKEKRGIDTYRRLQRHRDAAILDAKRLFAKTRLEGLLRVDKHDVIVQSMKDVGGGTSLVSAAQLRVLDGVSGEGERELAEALYELLHGDNSLGIRFERFVDVLATVTEKRPTWQLATVFLSVFNPKEHLCVKPGAMKTQALCAERGIKIPAIPSAPAYKRILKLAEDVRQHLVDAKYNPRDLVDVYDFIEATTSPKALQKIRAATLSAELEAA